MASEVKFTREVICYFLDSKLSIQDVGKVLFYLLTAVYGPVRISCCIKNV